MLSRMAVALNILPEEIQKKSEELVDILTSVTQLDSLSLLIMLF